MQEYWEHVAKDWDSFGEEKEIRGIVSEDERLAARAELDFLVAHDLFGLDRSEMEHVLGTFPIVERRENERYGEFRTKHLVLARYDATSEAQRIGKTRQTPLDSPPADPRAAHRASVVALPQRKPELPFEADDATSERYKTTLPLYRMKAAAGGFSDFQEAGVEAWVRPGANVPLSKKLCIVQVRGRSMEPEIPDGSYCLFERPWLLPKPGQVGIFSLHDDVDPDTGDRFTVKRLHLRRIEREDGPMQVGELVPANPEFRRIVVDNPEDWGGAIRPFAQFLKILDPGS